MRTALCLFGKIGGTEGKDGLGGYIDFRRCCKSYKEHVIVPNNCDVFIHCWSIELKKPLMELYRPKRAKFEHQVSFHLRAEHPKHRRIEYLGRSRWYSTNEVVQLKSKYEKEQGFVYDWVMFGRFDLMFFTDFNFSELNSKYLYTSNFNHRLKGQKTCATHENATRWNKTGPRYTRLADFWFLGSSADMNKFGYLYDRFYEYSPQDPHQTAWQHVDYMAGNPMKKLKFIKYYWFDFELYRTWIQR